MKPHQVDKKYRKLLVHSSRQKVVETLLKYPDKEFSLSDLAIEAGVAKQHLAPMLKELQEQEMIAVSRLGKIWRIRSNQSNWHYQKIKIIHNLNFIYQSGLVEHLSEHFRRPKAIVLFGSFRTGQDTTNSDIDLAIEVVDDIEQETLHLKELENFEKEIDRKIQIHLFNRHRVDPNVFASIANGIVLLGFLEVKP